jgi:hypothetical protein
VYLVKFESEEVDICPAKRDETTIYALKLKVLEKKDV